MKKQIVVMMGLVLGGCVSGRGGRTEVGPMPLKVGELREDSVELGIPLVYEKRKTGGWRSPVEVRIRLMLTSPVDVPLPLEPNGFEGGIRVRW